MEAAKNVAKAATGKESQFQSGMHTKVAGRIHSMLTLPQVIRYLSNTWTSPASKGT